MGRSKQERLDWPCSNENCTKRFTHKQSLNNHKKSCKHGMNPKVTSSNLACKVCQKTFHRPVYLKTHRCKGARKEALVTCNICNKSFKKAEIENKVFELFKSK